MSIYNPKPSILNQHELRPFVEKFKIGDIQEWEFLAEGYSISNHKITTDMGCFVAKETFVRDQRDIPVMYNFLVEAGIPTTNCYPRKSDSNTYSLKLPNGNSLFVQNFLHGNELQPDYLKDNPNLWYNIGKMIGTVQDVGTSDIFTKRNWKTEKFDITKVDERLKQNHNVSHIQEYRKDELLSAIEILNKKTDKLDTSSFIKGLIHGDWYATCFILDDYDNNGVT